MVKSFQGEAIRKEDDGLQSIVVSDYMAKQLITFKEHQTMVELMDALLKHKISGACVVNDENELIGVISEGDTLKDAVKGKYDNMPNKSATIGECMTRNPIFISPEMDVFEVADIFLNKRIRRLPVVKNGKLVGQVSQRDIIRAIKEMKTANWKH
jgi:CBS domain-containing protein